MMIHPMWAGKNGGGDLSFQFQEYQLGGFLGPR